MNPQENEQTQLLREILKWIRFAGMKEVKSTLVSVLDTEIKKLAYHLSDGSRGTVEIANLAEIGSNKTIFDMWQAWLRMGLGESIPVRGGSRFKRFFDLEDFAIELPTIKANKKDEAAKSTTTEKGSSSDSEQITEGSHA